jgi:multidrug resistance efflux pump
MSSHLHPQHLFLDLLIAAVFLMTIGLTLFIFFQAPATFRFAAHPNPMAGLPRIFQPIVIEVNGRVKSVNMREGSHLHRGDVLLQLETGELLLKKHRLERLIHFAEDHRSNASELYRELKQTRILIGRHTITSPAEGEIMFSVCINPGDVVQSGTAIGVQVIESPHAHYSLWPALHR